MARKKQITDFNWQVPSIALSFIQGADAPAFYGLMEKRAKKLGSPDCLKAARYDSDTNTVIGSNFFTAVLADNIARQQGMRVAMPQDENHSPLKEMVRGKHYTDFPCLDVRSNKHTYDLNKEILEKVIELAEEKQGKVQFPFRISGFDLNKTEEGYKLIVVPRNGDLGNITIINDERLSGKYNGKKFNKIDENGIPIFEKNGERTCYAKSDCVSGVCLGYDLGLYSYGDLLAGSHANGRVVLVSAEGGALGIEQYAKQIKDAYDAKLQKATQVRDKALSELEKV